MNLKNISKICNLKIIVTIRNINDLIVSKFLQDSKSIKLDTNIKLEKFVQNKSCFHPFCKSKYFLQYYKICFCYFRGYKVINPKIYSKKWLKNEFKLFNIRFFELISNNNDLNYNELKKMFSYFNLDIYQIKNLKINL